MRRIRPRGRDGGNSHNGRPTQLKITVLTEIGPVTIEVPRDTESTFEPQIVKKRQHRLTGHRRDRLVVERKGFDHG
jgi:putative transposase